MNKKKNKSENNKKLIVTIIVILIISIIIGLITLFFSKSWINTSIAVISVAIFLSGYFYSKKRMARSKEIKKMEDAFPDFLQLMSSNLRGGMTIDQALLLSSRKEFAPLDKEISALGKDIITGEKIEIALKDMADRINSERISKIITLITSGIRSGGNLATLLEKTASNMREKDFVEKRAASNVLMYIIFIFFAVAIGAPALFGLSTVLVQVMTNILSSLPPVETTSRLPFTLNQVNISVEFITYYAIIFLIVTDILGALVIGLVSKGEEKAGIKYMIPLLLFSISIFFAVRITLGGYFAGVFG